VEGFLVVGDEGEASEVRCWCGCDEFCECGAAVDVWCERDWGEERGDDGELYEDGCCCDDGGEEEDDSAERGGAFP